MPIKPLIAIVDDDRSFREATTEFFRSLDVLSKGYASGEEFIDSKCLHITSCLIADIRMPGMSGLALYCQLVAFGKPIPTILITAYPDDDMRARALDAGVAAYLVKPLDENELIDCINKALKHKAHYSAIER